MADGLFSEEQKKLLWQPSEQREILIILAKYLAIAARRSRGANNISDEIFQLDQKDAKRLASNIRKCLASRAFLNKTHFVEAMVKSLSPNSRAIINRFILQARYIGPTDRSEKEDEFFKFVNKYSHMPYYDFLAIEGRLFEEMGFDEKTTRYLVEFAELARDRIDETEQRKKHIVPRCFERHLARIAKSIQPDEPQPMLIPQMSSFNMASLAGLFTNFAVLGVSRDYTVTGTISGMAYFTATIKK